MDLSIKELMTKLPHPVGTQVTLKKAREMMDKYKCRHLPVLEENEIVGILSEHDLNKFERVQGAANFKVAEAMTDEPVFLEGDDKVEKAVKLMLDKKINSVIIRGKTNESWGIFTSTDALKYMMKLI